MSNWFAMAESEVIKSFATDRRLGLQHEAAQKKLDQVGHNQLHEGERISPWHILREQFTDFMVLVLIGAAIISGLLGEKADAVTIIAIVILNALLGFFQEYRAEKSLEALKELTAPLAHVLRGGQLARIAAAEIVPGDILVLESGDRVAADGRVIETVNLEANEAALTGESLGVLKNAAPLRNTHPALGDQHNMIFAGTVIIGGRGKAVVTATGMQTEIGKIAGMITTVRDEATPLQKRLEQLGRWLVILCLGICAAVATMGILRGEPPRQMFLAAVSLAVAAIPEGLPAIVTIALALGVQKMIKRRAIIRKLPAVETLGCATVICSDKTGTLTQNKLAVTKLWVADQEYEFNRKTPQELRLLKAEFRQLLEIGVLCNNTSMDAQGDVLGDPTELALWHAARFCGADPVAIGKQQSRAGEIPFTSERKKMSVWVKDAANRYSLLTKGAADEMVDRCSHIMTAAGCVPLNRPWRDALKGKLDQWGSEALRILAFARRDATGPEEMRQNNPENGMVMVGLMGMTDPPRPEVRLAVEKSCRAGIQTKMITGDYPWTAAAVAKQIGLLRPQGLIITGAELDQISDAKLARLIKDIDVCARVSPRHKLRLVKALKANGEIVAMTGDGINDAPAVKEADIGVAMGLSGTDVTKEAAAMIIGDDNYATIVAAVEEGRTIYDNIRKFIRYLLSCNMGEILTMFGGIMLGLPFPLLPIQILWVNLVTDGLPAIALGMEPAAPQVMQRPPRPPREGIFSRGLGLKIIFQGLMIGCVTLGVYLIKLNSGAALIEARTAAFAALVFAQLCFVFQCRSEEHTLFQLNPFQNKYLVGAALLSAAMQVIVMTLPSLQKIFYTCNLSFRDWFFILFLTLISAVASDLIWQMRRLMGRHLAIFRFPAHSRGVSVEK